MNKNRNDVMEPKTPQRNYKDTLFRMIFSERSALLSLYNAVNETDYSNPEELQIVTLENAIYLNMKNDLAYANLSADPARILTSPCFHAPFSRLLLFPAERKKYNPNDSHRFPHPHNRQNR